MSSGPQITCKYCGHESGVEDGKGCTACRTAPPPKLQAKLPATPLSERDLLERIQSDIERIRGFVFFFVVLTVISIIAWFLLFAIGF